MAKTKEYPREMRVKQYENGLYIVMRPHHAKTVTKVWQHQNEVYVHFNKDNEVLAVEVIAFPVDIDTTIGKTEDRSES